MRTANATIHVPIKDGEWSKKEQLHALGFKEARVGPWRGRTAGSWIHDLCALKKTILLCPACDSPRKFDPKKLGFIREKDWPHVVGKCDGCGTFDWKCAAFFWEETYLLARSTTEERRAIARSRQKRLKQGRL